MSQLLQAVVERLSVEDINGAWRAIQAQAADTPTGPLLAAIAEAAEPKWHPPLPETAQRAAASSDDAAALGALGSALIRVGEARLAADLLGRAVALAPDEAPLLAERVAALELTGDHAAALRAIQSAPASVRADTMIAYLHAFHLLIAGRIDAAAAIDIPDGAQAGFLRERQRARIARARALGLSDSRARIAAIAGTLPLHVSAEPVTEDPEQTATRIAELGAALRGLGLRPDRVAFLPTPNADSLAAWIAEHLGLPCAPYPGAGAGLALLVVVDLADISPERAADLRSREGLVLYAHWARSDREHAIAPEVVGTVAPAVRIGAGAPADESAGLFGAEDDSADDAADSGPFEGALPGGLGVADDALAGAVAAVGVPRVPRGRLWAGLGVAGR